jgi:hypothetical protein
MAADPEAALESMARSAQRLLEQANVVSAEGHPIDEGELANHVQAMHAEFVANWTTVRAAAASLERQPSDAAPTPSRSAEAPASLVAQRDALLSALAARDEVLKVQIDQLRETLCAYQLMDP